MEYLNSFGTLPRSKLLVALEEEVVEVAKHQFPTGKRAPKALVHVQIAGSVVSHQQIVPLVRQLAVQVVMNAPAAVVEVQWVIGKPVPRALVPVLTTGSVVLHQQIVQLKRPHAVQVAAIVPLAKWDNLKNEP